MGKYVSLNDDNFEEIVLRSDKPVLVDFWATWCGPCRMLAPTIEEIADEMDGRAIVAKADVDECSKTAERYGVMSVPTLILFKNGVEADKMVGVRPKGKIVEMIVGSMN